jgi:hypothetical protein
MGCLEYVLEKTANMSPNLVLERNNGCERKSGVEETADADADTDDPIVLDDNDFLIPPTRKKMKTMKV